MISSQQNENENIKIVYDLFFPILKQNYFWISQETIH